MICKNCGTKFDSSQPDENGVVICPECGKRYRKSVPAPQEYYSSKESGGFKEKFDAAKEKVTSGCKSFMQMKIAGKYPAWWAAAAGALVLILLIILLASGGGAAGSPEDVVSKLEDALNGDLDDMWEIMTYRDKNNYDSFDEFEKENKDIEKKLKDQKIEYSLDFVKYNSTHTYEDQPIEEEGQVKFDLEVKFGNETKKINSQTMNVIKIDGNWYLNDDIDFADIDRIFNY